MISTRNREIFWFCLALALAIALASVGVIILYDFLSGGPDTPGRISLHPGSGFLSLLLSGTFLALLFQRPKVCTATAILGLITALVMGSMPFWPVSRDLSAIAINPALLLVTVLIFLSALAAIHTSRGWRVGLIAMPVVFSIGLFSLLSRWLSGSDAIGIGSHSESIWVVSPLMMLIGLTLPFLRRIYHRDIPVYSRALILLGVLGIFATTMTWHVMRLQHSENLISRAESQSAQLAASTASAFSIKLALIRRLAERWELTSGAPSELMWQHEADSYLRDFPELRLVALLNKDLAQIRVESSSLEDRYLLDSFFTASGSRSWLIHTIESNAPHLSEPIEDRQGTAHAIIAAPISAPGSESGAVVAVVNLESFFKELSMPFSGNIEQAVFYDRKKVFDSSTGLPESNKVQLTAATVEPHHDHDWRIESYIAKGTLAVDQLYLPPMILFGGIGLSFLVMLSHLFWRESERRSIVLGDLNNTLNHHLEQERSLRQTNDRIMQFSKDLLCSISPAGRFLAVSPASRAMLGYEPEELQGRHYGTLLMPEDRDSTVEEFERLASGQQDTSTGFRTRLRHKDGQTVTVSWTAEWSREDHAMFCVGRDITDELVAETLSRERNQFFSLSPDMFCIVDLNSHFFEMNHTFLETLGYTREQLLGTSYMKLIHPEDHEKVVSAVNSLTEGNTVQDLSVRALDTRSDVHWLHINAILSADDLIYVVARDVTDALETRERLAQSEALLRIAEKTAMIGGWNFDISSGKLTWTSAMFDIFEVPEGAEPDLDTGLSWCTDGSRESLTAAIELCISTGIPFDEEVQFRTLGGRLRWGRAIGHAVKDETGRIVRLQGGFQDITASRQTMDQIRRYAERQVTIFESITDAFFTVDRDWRFTYVNRRSEEILQKPREELLGHTLWEMFPAAVGSEFDRQYRYAVETGESVFFEAYYEPLDNWLEISAYPSDEGLAVYYRSIRERKEAQMRLEATMEELERSNRDLQDFAFVASHDLQEPLRKIRAFSDRLLVKSDQFGPDEQDYLRRMQSAAARMQALISDLLTYSRVTTRAKTFEECDTHAIFQGVLQDMETSIANEKAIIEISPLPTILGDASQLRQVFQNLLSNALKFHKPGKPPRIMVYPEEETSASWVMTVKDDGIGFDQKYADKIFHPFKRLHSRDTYAGTGIGMAIVKKILDRHGAAISVSSAPGEGTTFRIHFRYRGSRREGIHGRS